MPDGYIFISYDRDDSQYVNSLADELVRHGIGVWFDRSITIDQNFRWEIEARVAGCAAFLLVMTPNSSESRWVWQETAQAISTGRKLCPLLLAGDPQTWQSILGEHQIEDVRGGDWPSESFFDRLRELTGGDHPPPWIPQPRQPARHVAARRHLFDGHEYTDVRELVLAMYGSWAAAVLHIDSTALKDWLVKSVQDTTMPENILDCTDPELAIAQLGAHFAPDAPPVYRGHRVDPAGLAEICALAEAGDAHATETINGLASRISLLRRYARHRCTSGHPQCSGSTPCQVMMSAVDQLAQAMGNHATLAEAIEEGSAAIFVHCLVEPAHFVKVHSDLAKVDTFAYANGEWEKTARLATATLTIDSLRAHAIALPQAKAAAASVRDSLEASRGEVRVASRSIGAGLAGMLCLPALAYLSYKKADFGPILEDGDILADIFWSLVGVALWGLSLIPLAFLVIGLLMFPFAVRRLHLRTAEVDAKRTRKPSA